MAPVQNGDVLKYLASEAGEVVNKVILLHQTAEGMEYLHGREILHGDLKVSCQSHVHVPSYLTTSLAGLECSSRRGRPSYHLRLWSQQTQAGHQHPIAADFGACSRAGRHHEVAEPRATEWIAFECSG